MADQIGKLSIDLEARIAKFESDIGRAARILQRDLVNAQKKAERQAIEMRKTMERELQAIQRSAGRVTSALVAFFSLRQGIRLAQDLGRVADAYANIQAKVRLAAGDQANLARSMEAVFGVAQRTFNSLDGTAALVQRGSTALQNFGMSASEAFSNSLALAETFNKALVISGANTMEAQAAAVQFSQALASGKFQGDEFRSVLENNSRFAQLLADSLGVNIAQLREMSKAGKLTTADMLGLLNRTKELDAQFASMPVTIARAWVQLENSFTMLVGQSDEVSSISGTVARAIQAVSQALDILAPQVRELVGLWADQSGKQLDVAATAETIAYGMKTVVTGLVLAKNAIEVVISALQMLAEIGVASVTATAQSFQSLAAVLPKIAERIINPFAAFNDVDLFGQLFARQQAILAEFATKAEASITGFAEKAAGSVADVSVAFEFLEKSTKATVPAVAAAAGHVGRLAGSAAKTEKEIDKLARTQKRMADLLDRLRGELSPVEKAWADYEKAVRSAEAIGAQLLKQGESTVKVERDVAEAVKLAARARDEALDTLKKEADVTGRLLATMAQEVRLSAMTTKERRVEELVLKAVAEAQEEANRQKIASIALDEKEQEALRRKLRGMDDLIEKNEKLREAAEKAAEDFRQVWERLAEDLGDALGDAIFEGGQAGLDSLKRAFESWARSIMKQRFVIPIQAAFQQGSANGGGFSGGIQSVMAGFGNNFGNGTGFRNSASAGGGMNWGNVGQFAAGVYGVYDTYRNGEGGSGGALSGAAAGAQAGMVFGPWGAAIGAIVGALAGYFGGGEPTIRVSDRERDATARSHLDDVIGVARDRFPEGTATRFAQAIAAFDNQIADLLDSYSGGGEQLERVRDALRNWSIRVEGDAATIENVLEERFGDIMATFTDDVRAFVEQGIGLEEQVNRLAQVLVWPDQIQGLLAGFREAELLGGMSELERATYQTNQQFDALREQFEEMQATATQLEELERFRGIALAELSGTIVAGSEAAEDATRSYAEFVDGFDTVGSPFQRALAGLAEAFAANTRQANDLARAAGLQGARVEDLAQIEADYLRQREEAIAGLTATVVGQIASLYGTSAEQIEQRIAGIDQELANLAPMRSEGTFGLVFALLEEARLTAERSSLVAELETQRAAEEALRRQTEALDLAQNLADLTLARGIGFDALAGELGLDLNRFGADLGLTADGVRELIGTLQAESLTADVFGDGVQAIVDAINGIIAKQPDPDPPENINPPNDPTGGKSLRMETEAMLLEEIKLLRAAVERVERHTGATAGNTEALPAIAAEGRRLAVREVAAESRITNTRKPLRIEP